MDNKQPLFGNGYIPTWFPPPSEPDVSLQQQAIISLAAQSSQQQVTPGFHHNFLNHPADENQGQILQSGATASGFSPKSKCLKLCGNQDAAGGYGAPKFTPNAVSLSSFQTVDNKEAELLDLYKKNAQLELKLAQMQSRVDFMNQKFNYFQEVVITSRQTITDLRITVQDLTVKNQSLEYENAKLKRTQFRFIRQSFQGEAPPSAVGILVPDATEPPSTTRSNGNYYQGGGQQQTSQGYKHHSTGTRGRDNQME